MLWAWKFFMAKAFLRSVVLSIETKHWIKGTITNSAANSHLKIKWTARRLSRIRFYTIACQVNKLTKVLEACHLNSCQQQWMPTKCLKSVHLRSSNSATRDNPSRDSSLRVHSAPRQKAMPKNYNRSMTLNMLALSIRQMQEDTKVESQPPTPNQLARWVKIKVIILVTHLELLINMIGQRLPIYLTRARSQRSWLQSLTPSSTITCLYDWEKSSMKSTSLTIWSTWTCSCRIILEEMRSVARSLKKTGRILLPDWSH